MRHRLAHLAQLEPVARQQLVHAAVDGARRRDVAELQVLAERVGIDLGVPRLEGAQRLQLRAEPEVVAVPRVVEGLHAHAVAQQHQAALALVPDGDGEHADEAVDRRHAPLLVGGEDHLGVARAAEAVAERLELGAHAGEVVDLAVEDHGERAVAGEHRLVPQRARGRGSTGAHGPAPRARPGAPRRRCRRARAASGSPPMRPGPSASGRDRHAASSIR